MEKNVEKLILDGFDYLKKLDIDRAEKIFLKILSLDEINFHANYYLGVIAFEGCKLELALEYFKKASDIDKNNISARINIGVVREKLNLDYEAILDFSDVLKKESSNVDALYGRGVAYRKIGDYESAIKDLSDVINLNNKHFNSINNRGLCYKNTHRLALAESDFNAVLEIDQMNFEAINGLGIIFLESKNYDRAIDLFERGISHHPHNFELYNNIGTALACKDLHQMAIEKYDIAILINPSYYDAYFNKAVSLAKLGRNVEAIEVYKNLCGMRTDNGSALARMAELEVIEKNYSNAIKIYQEAISKKYQVDNCYYALGVIYKEVGDKENSIKCYKYALNFNPNNAKANNNLGLLIGEKYGFEESIQYFLAAIRNADGEELYIDAYNNLGVAYMGVQKLEEATDCFNKVIHKDHEHHSANWNKSIAMLCMGNFSIGWELHEARWKANPKHLSPERFGDTFWFGNFPIAGKKLLIHAEQGLGDTIQFSRYVHLMAEMDCEIIFFVQDPLVQLFERQFSSNVKVTSIMPRIGDFDCHIPLMSLPYVFGTTLETVPFPKAYLHSDPDKAILWRKKLEQSNQIRVGLVWAGGDRPAHPEFSALNARRNLPFEYLFKLNNSRIQFISLQKGNPAELEFEKFLQSDSSKLLNICNYSSDFKNFSDTAALIENLDLVISVDTSTAHLAAAMGKPVWLLNRFDTCWRWMLQREDSPWYASIKIYRQNNPGDWVSVLSRVDRDLKNFLKSKN